MNELQKYLSTCLLATAALLGGVSTAWAQGTAADFAVLSAAPLNGGAVTCTRGSITGNVGSSGPSTSVVLNDGCTTGPIIAPVSAGVLTDFNRAYNTLAAVSCDRTLTGTLDGVTVPPGVSCFDAAAAPTGTVTLSGGPTDTWLFKIGTKAVGALSPTDFTVALINGATACNVTWWVDAAATVIRGDFKGTILAGAAISITGVAPATPVEGRALAKAGVTLTDVAFVGCTGGTSLPGTFPPACSDRVTGGGFITVSGKKANFGVTGGISRKGKLRGHLTYIDHGTKLKVKGTGVTKYVAVDATTRRIEGTAEINGVAGSTYTVVVSDNGKGGETDTFAITLSTGGVVVYSATGTLAGGNIRLHKRHCDKNGHDRDGDDDDDVDDDDHDEDGEHKGPGSPYFNPFL